jgi:hypothetical protein
MVQMPRTKHHRILMIPKMWQHVGDETGEPFVRVSS